MEEESYPGIDYNQIEGLQRKRLLKFVNHFVLQTSHFLSNFSQTCDMKLLNLAKKIQNMETSLSLLEMKLDSVPELKLIPVVVHGELKIRQKCNLVGQCTVCLKG